MSWYNTYSENTRRLEQLLDSHPSFAQLLEQLDFIDALKAYNPKLLEYITNSFELPREIIKYLTEPPKESDSDIRKYKLPYLTVSAVETNTTCIVNCFLKINPHSQRPFFVEMFDSMLARQEQLLPLLCGYFSQVNLILWNNRYRETIDMVYDFKTPLFHLAKHTQNRAIVNTLLLYLNLDMTRNSEVRPERSQLKLQIIKNLLGQIRTSYDAYKKDEKNQRAEIMVENICDVMIEVVEKYYLIADGNLMLEVILSQENVNLIMDIVMTQTNLSFSVMGLAMVFMRYYCLSSFNQPDIRNPEFSKKNEERLESQPFIKKITELIPKVSADLAQTKKLSIYHSRLIEIFIPVIELSSFKTSKIVRESKFLENLLSLLFKWPNLSIVHKLVERAFFAVFNSDRKVCQDYRKYLFCEACIIEKTVGECLKRVDKIGEKSLKMGWFSHLMKIVLVYSKIQTTDDEVNDAIMRRGALWQRFKTSLLDPYLSICNKDLGSYQTRLQKAPVQYSVRTMGGGLEMMNQVSKKIIEEVFKQESMQQFLTTIPDKSEEKRSVDTLFDTPNFEGSPEKNSEQVSNNQIMTNVLTMDAPNSSNMDNRSIVPHVTEQPKIVQKEEAIISETIETKKEPENVLKEEEDDSSMSKFAKFLNSKKAQITHERETLRKNSSEKKLSAKKHRFASPSPKQRKWDSGNHDEEIPAPKSAPIVNGPKIPQKQKISLANPNLRLPPGVPQSRSSPRPLSDRGEQTKPQQKEHQSVPQISEEIMQKSAVLSSLQDQKIVKSISFDGDSGLMENKSMSQLHSSRATIEDIKEMMSKSAISLGGLKKIQIKKERLPARSQKKGRTLQENDKLLLDFLGYPY